MGTGPALILLAVGAAAALLNGVGEMLLLRARARVTRAALARLRPIRRLLLAGRASPTTSLLLALRLGRLLAAVVMAVGLTPLLGSAWLALIAALSAVFVVGLLLPVRLASGDPTTRLQQLAPALLVLLLPAAPLAALLLRLGYASRAADEHGEDAGGLREAIELAEQEGRIQEAEGEMLHGVFEFRRTMVREIMQPRIDMICAPAGATVTEIRDLAIESKHSRLPIYGENLDDIRGVVSVKDLLQVWREGDPRGAVAPLVRPVRFVPETKLARDLLVEFQRERLPLAIVVDEYGGTAGMVTVEDLVEEIVGEIQDEYDKDEEPALARQSDGSLLVLGKCDIHEVEDALGRQFRAGGFETAGGLVFERLGRVPKSGELVETDGVAIKVLEADERRIYKLLFRLLEHAPPAP